MAALVPSVSTTELATLNSTNTVASGWMEMFLTLPTSTPAIRTKFPPSSPDTLANWAL
ncbi:hypothetical protein MYXE_07900 [Mycobacterium xenopi]|uniref:Uncharacterized protein n=1 Tax=Mycobacterium xenopi TaxID=1789 RepID=A0AAD1GXD5_MYCXE|nr:hypothetical protein MYXE_07900 [Mycobacterium xenopi]